MSNNPNFSNDSLRKPARVIGIDAVRRFARKPTVGLVPARVNGRAPQVIERVRNLPGGPAVIRLQGYADQVMRQFVEEDGDVIPVARRFGVKSRDITRLVARQMSLQRAS